MPKKKKPNVKDIDGVLWLLDDNGNRIKKVRKKVKPGDNDALWVSNHSGSKSQMGTLDGFSEHSSLRRRELMTKSSANLLVHKNSRTLQSSMEPNSRLGGNQNSQIAELSKQVANYGEENRALKTQLMAFEEKVRMLTQQNRKEKSKNVKATTEMLQLKADYQQASDEKRNLDLQFKNLEARYREKEQELEKLESTPANRGGGDHLVTQINDLMAENDALLDKLDLAKASSGHDAKMKEEQILFLNEELRKVREENEMLFLGEAEKDPLMGRLLKQKEDIEAKLGQEREKSSIRIDSMQERIETLEKSNAGLKKELEKVTLVINDDDDADVRRAKEMAAAVARTNGNARQQRRGSGFWGFRDQ